MFYYKIHESHAGYLIAACDKSICGKTLKSKGLEFHVNPRFYKDKTASPTQMKKLLQIASSANLIGKDVVQLAVDLGLIDKENVIKIQGIPHAQVVVVQL
ncbi:DUF424 family protein [Candidatus Woesearchaeota archaeon]|jgi:uncharacterized protein|nr:DUF424 family protein [Candidatus Woesearchaeota archaeon]MBT4114394.1 DUF424 family protein [Candidatus Woesearchaeota archaeon]MBT4248590.1 DUF424 family protein [Candidatus Woesearchaeota archaeon]